MKTNNRFMENLSLPALVYGNMLLYSEIFSVPYFFIFRLKIIQNNVPVRFLICNFKRENFSTSDT